MTTYLLSFVAACATTLALTPLARGLATRWGVVDCPDGRRKLQKSPIPLLGGVAVLVGWWLGLAMVEICGLSIWLPSVMPKAALAFSALLLVGVYDDAFGLRARWKLLAQIATVLPIALSTCALDRVAVCGWTLNVGVWGIPLTLLWLVLGINALNLIDGMDGMAAMAGLCIALTTGAIDLASGGGLVALVTFSLAGALAGFLVFNFPPARIYLGDAGSMVIGLAVSLAALVVARTDTGATRVSLMLAVMSVPLADMALAIVRRSLAGRSIWHADRGHIHHRLIDAGWRPWQILCLLVGVALLWGTLVTVVRQGPYEVVIWGAGVLVAILAVRWRLAGFDEWLLFKRVVQQSRIGGRALPTADELVELPFATSWVRLVQVCSDFACARLTLSVRLSDGSRSELAWTAESQDPLLENALALEISRESRERNWCRLRVETTERPLGRNWARAIVALERFAEFWADHPHAVIATPLRLHDDSERARPIPPNAFGQNRAA